MGIVKGAAAEFQFFSVRKPVVFGGKTYRPSICYKVTSDVFDTVSALSAKGGADLYTSQVRFVSGRAQPVAQPVVVAPVLIGPDMSVGVRTDDEARAKPSRKQSSSASPKDGEYVEAQS